MNFRSPGFLMLSALFTSCGGGAAAGSENTPGIEGDMGTEHQLVLVVDGTRFEAKGHPFGPAIHYGAREINVQVGGPLTSAVAAGEEVSLGDSDLIANILANDIVPGAYSLVASQVSVTRSAERIGFAEFFFPESSPLGQLRPVSGTLTIETVKGQDEDKRYRLERVTGRIEGKFMDKAFTEHRVEGTFEYAR